MSEQKNSTTLNWNVSIVMAYSKCVEVIVLIIKRHLIYVDSKSIRKIGPEDKKKGLEEEMEEEIRRKAEEIIKSAQEEAEGALKDAREKAEKIVEDAKEKARLIMEDAKRKAKKEVEEIGKLKEDISRFREKLNDQIEKVARNVAENSLPILKVIYKKILEKDIDEELALRRVQKILERIYTSEKVRIRISPQDEVILSDLVEELNRKGFEIVVDPDLQKGDVLVETSKGVMDKTTSFRWNMIEDVIDEIL